MHWEDDLVTRINKYLSTMVSQRHWEVDLMAAINYYLVRGCGFNPCPGQVSQMVYFERNKYQNWFMWFILRVGLYDWFIQSWFIRFTLGGIKLQSWFFLVYFEILKITKWVYIVYLKRNKITKPILSHTVLKEVNLSDNLGHVDKLSPFYTPTTSPSQGPTWDQGKSMKLTIMFSENITFMSVMSLRALSTRFG